MTDASPKSLQARDRHRDEEPLVRRRVLALAKYLARSVVRAPKDERRIVLIFGCQRSGTTMLQQTFLDRSWRILILEEADRRLIGDHLRAGEINWEDYSTVVRRLRRIPFEVVAAKPLVESDHAVELLDAAAPAKGIWMLRHYQGVARSNLRRFGATNSYRDLESICKKNPQDWRCRGATQQTQETVSTLMNHGLSPIDAAALFWWARNQLYFEQQLWCEDRIRLIRYERACAFPEELVESLSDYVGVRLPSGLIASKIHSEPDLPATSEFHPEVERLCSETWHSFAGRPEL